MPPQSCSAATAHGNTRQPSPEAGAERPRIAYVTARLLEEFHYSQQRLDPDMSRKFFDGYLESLDQRHEHFLQPDLAGFARYRTNLDTLAIGTNGTASLAPAYDIYRRYLERVQQHADYVNELLQEDKFKFNTDEHILLDRRHAPYPKDLDEAKKLWSQRLLPTWDFISRAITSCPSSITNRSHLFSGR